MGSNTKLDMLREIPLFSRLGKSDLELLARLADEIDVPESRVLMRQGESGSEMFVVAAGRVRVERDGEQIAALGPGDWLGEMALISEGPRTATAVTTEPSRLFVVSHREFHSLMDQIPSVRVAVDECVAERIRRLESASPH